LTCRHYSARSGRVSTVSACFWNAREVRTDRDRVPDWIFRAPFWDATVRPLCYFAVTEPASAFRRCRWFSRTTIRVKDLVTEEEARARRFFYSRRMPRDGTSRALCHHDNDSAEPIAVSKEISEQRYWFGFSPHNNLSSNASTRGV